MVVVFCGADPGGGWFSFFGDDPSAGSACLIPLGVDLFCVFGGAPAVVQGPVDCGEHVGLRQASVLVAGVVDAGIE